MQTATFKPPLLWRLLRHCVFLQGRGYSDLDPCSLLEDPAINLVPENTHLEFSRN